MSTILHEPYGIDDPYKRLVTERYPRDPLPGDDVQIGFRTTPDASRAWVELLADSENRCVPADSLGEGLWTAELGQVDTGEYAYTIHAAFDDAQEASAAFHFEVGRWIEVQGIKGVQPEPRGFTVTLTTSEEPAKLLVSFPIAGVCRTVLEVGYTRAPAFEGLPCAVQQGKRTVTASAHGINITINRETLELAASLPEAGVPAAYVSLRGRWLVDAQGQVTRFTIPFQVRPNEWLYGLGERFTEANRSGQAWDVRVYEEYKEQGKRTYLPVPLLISNNNYGLWLQVNEPSYFDLTGTTGMITTGKLPSKAADLPLYLMVGEQPYDITAAFTQLTGTIAVPPKWAFGPWMSANTWNNQAKAEQVVGRTLQEDVPATVLVLEAWSDESTFYIFNDADYEPKPGGEAHTLADFRFGGRWPDPKAFIDYCHDNGIRVLLWQIPVQKKLSEPHGQHDLDEAYMLEQGFYIRNEDGSPYRNKGWWFPEALILDFTNPAAHDWWFSKRRYLFDDLGIDGMKTDGGEHLWGRDLRAFDDRRGLELFNTYANLYVEAYHSFIQKVTGSDGVTFSRAGYTGAQQFPCHWAGDEDSTWTAYRAAIRAGLSAGISGISMWSWDLAGFSGEIPSAELYLRAAAMATFCPVMQFHSEPHGATECRDRTPWNIAERHNDATALSIYRCFAEIRMHLLDYIHEEAGILSTAGRPLMRYPALEFCEAHDFLAEDPYAYLFGRDLLIAPVTEKGVETRAVRLPPGGWVDIWSGVAFEGSRIVWVPAPIDRIPVFVQEESPRLQRLLAVANG